jgi:hypothetical protein
MPDNETINKHIHEMMGGHWHDYGSGDRCACGVRSHDDEFDGEGGPEYTSDDSPRRLLNEAVDKAVEMVGPYIFGRALAKQIDLSLPQDFDGVTDNELPSRVTFITSATAQQIATAIYHATKEEGK